MALEPDLESIRESGKTELLGFNLTDSNTDLLLKLEAEIFFS